MYNGQSSVSNVQQSFKGNKYIIFGFISRKKAKAENNKNSSVYLYLYKSINSAKC